MNHRRTWWLVVSSAVAVAVSLTCWQLIPVHAQDGNRSRSRRPRTRIATASLPHAVADADVLRSGWNADAEADWPAAEVLASASDIAYLSPESAERKFQALGFDQARAFQVDTLWGYVASTKDVAVIAFRGTDDLEEWIINLDAFAHNTPHGDVHNGYYKAYRALKPQITRLLDEHDNRKVWITGHSLGGALALICAYDMIAQENQRPHGVMTFGQPMVVDRFLASYLDDRLAGRYVHFVNGQDIVPRLLPRYAHCGSLVWFTQGKVVRSKPHQRPFTTDYSDPRADRLPVIEPLTDEEFADLKAELRRPSRRSSANIRRASFSKQSPEWVEDHSMSVYLRRIRSAVE